MGRPSLIISILLHHTNQHNLVCDTLHVILKLNGLPILMIRQKKKCTKYLLLIFKPLLNWFEHLKFYLRIPKFTSGSLLIFSITIFQEGYNIISDICKLGRILLLRVALLLIDEAH